jgi:hypothetical protein
MAPLFLAACSRAGTTPALLPPSGAAPSRPVPSRPLSQPGGAVYYGCPAFQSGPYTKQVTGSPTDPHSADYISSVIQAGDTYGFYASTGVEQVNLANNKTPLLTVQPKSKYHSFPVPYPWDSSFYIEPLGDHHAMVVQTQSCRLYEAYDTSYSNGTLSAYSGAHWRLTRKFKPLPPGNPSSMASGLSLFAGMVRWEDYESGSIAHALNWDGIAHTVAQYLFVDPASDTDRLTFYGTSPYQMPYGARLRLQASFSTQGWGPQATMVANAMKTYGVYLADTGSDANGIYFANDEYGNNPWNWSDLSSLSQITMSDFDVIKLPPIQTVP